jgi:hypothetical protein
VFSRDFSFISRQVTMSFWIPCFWEKNSDRASGFRERKSHWISGSWEWKPNRVAKNQESYPKWLITTILVGFPILGNPIRAPVSKNPEFGAGSVPGNPEPIVPRLKMKEKICLNTPVGLNARRNELWGGFQVTELEADIPIRKSTRNSLCVRKGSIKHHEFFLYFLAMIQYVVCGTSVIHSERNKKVDCRTCLCSFVAESWCSCTQAAWIAAVICKANMW